MRQIEVFGGTAYINGTQRRVIVAATSMHRVSKLTGLGYGYLRDWWCRTGNEAEIAAAKARPEIPLMVSDDRRSFTPVPDGVMQI